MLAKKLYSEVGNPYTWEEIEEEGLNDFRVFLAHVWDFLNLPSPTPVQYDIANSLQTAPRRIIINAFRGVGKSWVSVAFCLWVLLLNPQAKVEVVSASSTLAKDLVSFSKQIIRGMPLLQHLKAQRGQRDKSDIFDVGPALASKDPSFKAAGINGAITGSRADIILADDIEVANNSYTHHLREKLAYQVKEFDAILKPGGRVIFLGTPQTEESIYPRLRERGYKTRIWPAEAPPNLQPYVGLLAPYVQALIDGGMEPGDPVDPERFDSEDLAERRLSYGKSGYALQFLLDTTPSDADKHPLKLKDLIVLDLDNELSHVKFAWGNNREDRIEDLPSGGFDGDYYYSPAYTSDEMAEYTGTVLAIDPSGRGNDETAYAIVRYLHGNLFLVAVGGFRSGFSEDTLKTIAATAARYDVNRVIAEDNFGGGMFRELLKPHLAKYEGKAGTFDPEWDGWSRGQKEIRVLDTLEPVLGSHRLIVDRKVIENDLEIQRDKRRYSFVQQMTRMHRDRDALPNDDRIEAVAMACQYWVEKMARDPEKEVERHRGRLLKQELKKIKQHQFSVHSRTKKQGNSLPTPA